MHATNAIIQQPSLLLSHYSIYSIKGKFELNQKTLEIPTECASYRPIMVSCNISKMFEYLLLPSVNSSAYFCENQIGFSAGVGCQQAHRVLANVLTEATKKGFELHLCALDLSKAFDTVMHSQAIFSLFSHGINILVIFFLRYWYSNSFLLIKTDMRVTDSKIPI